MNRIFSSLIFSGEETNQKTLKLTAAILGYLFFIAFFAIAWFFYKERMIPFDGAFYTFKMIDSQWFNLELGRNGAALSQVLPLLSIYLGCDLETIIRLYSINFILVQFVVFALLYYKFKDYKNVLALLLALCIGYRYQYYYTVSEIHQTLAPVVLLFALIKSPLLHSTNKRDTWLFFLSFSVLCLLLANIHILSIVLISYVVGFSVIENREVLFKKKLWASIVVGYSFFIYKILAIQAGGYDSSKMLTAEKIKMTLTNLSEIPSFIFFKEEFVKGYYVLIIACLLMVGLLIYRKKWLDLSYIAFSLIGFFILSIAYNITNDSPVIYQNYYACLGFIIAIPLAKELVSVFQMKIVAALISILLIASLYKIVQCGRMYELRMEYFSRMENNVKGFPESKFMLSTNNINWNMIWMDWNLGFETLLHSAIASPDSAVTFTVENDYSVHDSMMYRPNTFIGVRFSPYWFTSENMPQKYFRIKHTPYRILNKIPNDSLVNSGFNKSNVSIDFDKECDTTLSLFSYQMIPVEITNNSNDTLYSYKTEGKSIALGYKLYDKSGELLKTVPAASNLELDVYPHDSKRSSVNLDYVKRGTYTLEIDLVENETKWLGGSKKKTFTIY